MEMRKEFLKPNRQKADSKQCAREIKMISDRLAELDREMRSVDKNDQHQLNMLIQVKRYYVQKRDHWRRARAKWLTMKKKESKTNADSM